MSCDSPSIFETAKLHFYKSQYSAAIECFENMRQLAVSSESLKDESSALQGLGMTYKEMGNYRDALAKLGQSLEIQQRIGDVGGSAASLLSIGNVHVDECQYDLALQAYSQCKDKFHQISHFVGECGANHSMGNVYHIIGQYDKSVELLEESLAISKQLSNLQLENASSQVLGSVFDSIGQHDRALVLLQRSIELSKDLEDLDGESKSYATIGSVYESLGKLDQALEAHSHSLDIKRRLGKKAGEGRSLNSIGNIYHARGDYDAALESLRLAYDCAVAADDVEGKARTQFALGTTCQRRGEFAAAAGHLEGAIRACEDLQARLGDRDASRVAIFDQQRRCYVCLVSNLLRLGREADALAASERGKARALRHLLSAAETPTTAKSLPAAAASVNSGALAQEVGWEEIQAMVAAEGVAVLAYAVLDDHEVVVWLVSPAGELLACSRTRLAGRGPGTAGSLTGVLELALCAVGARGRDALARDAGSLSAVKERADRDGEARRSLELATSAVDGTHRVVPRGEVGAALLARLQKDPAALDAATAALRRHRMVCDWLDGVCDPSAPASETGAVDREELRAAVAAAKTIAWDWASLLDLSDEALVKAGAVDASARAAVLARIEALGDEDRVLKELYELLIGPVEASLSGHPDLLIVPDSDLWVVPWAALRDGQERYLVESHSLRLAPSLRTAREAAAARGRGGSGSGGAALVVGGPTHQGYDPLPYAVEEANSVAILVEARPLTGARATKAEVARALHGTDWAHMACHGCLERRALVLSPGGREGEEDGGLLTAEEVHTCGRLAAGATVVLSACNSARGPIRGEGVVGLSRAFLAAGAAAAAVSLWSVPDQRTKWLMDAVYAALKQGYHLPQALRFAMIMMLRHLPPVSWAGFVVVGASTALPPRSPDGGVAGWDCERVCACFKDIGFDSSAVRANGVDGKTLLSLSDEDMVSELGLRRLQVKRIRAEIEQASAGAVRPTLAALAAVPTRTSRDFDLAAMETAFNYTNGTWLFQVARAAGGSDGDGNASRNYNSPQGPEDKAALAGQKEREALELLGYSFWLGGRAIGNDHGILSNGYLSTEALRECLGLVYPDTYVNMWGADGKVVQRAQERLLADPGFVVGVVVSALRAAVEFRLEDRDKKCLARKACRLAVADCVSRVLPNSIQDSNVTIQGLYDVDGWLEVAFRATIPTGLSAAGAATAAELVGRTNSATVVEAMGRALVAVGKGSQANHKWARAAAAGIVGQIVGAAEVCGCLSARLRLSGGIGTAAGLLGCMNKEERKRSGGHEVQLQRLKECVAALEALEALA